MLAWLSSINIDQSFAISVDSTLMRSRSGSSTTTTRESSAFKEQVAVEKRSSSSIVRCD